jgi:hypothetical protein
LVIDAQALQPSCRKSPKTCSAGFCRSSLIGRHRCQGMRCLVGLNQIRSIQAVIAAFTSSGRSCMIQCPA